MKAHPGRRVHVFDSQRKAVIAMDQDHSQRPDRHLRRMVRIIRPQHLLRGGMTIHQQIFRKAARWRSQSQRAFLQPNHSNVTWYFCGDLDTVVGSGPKTVVALLQPAQADQRQPALRRLQVCRPFRSPRCKFRLPRTFIRRSTRSPEMAISARQPGQAQRQRRAERLFFS